MCDLIYLIEKVYLIVNTVNCNSSLNLTGLKSWKRTVLDDVMQKQFLDIGTIHVAKILI